MSFDFNYGDSTINSSGGFIPTKKNAPTNPREVVDTYADIADIPNPYVGLTVTVKVDETNNNKMTDYKVISLKSNNLGIADMLIDQVQRMDEYLGVSSSGSGTGGTGLTSEQEERLNKIPEIETSINDINESLNTKANTSDIPTKTSKLTNDSGFLTSIPSEYVTETEMNEAIANVSTGYATKDELNTKANISDIPTKTSKLTNDSGFLTSIPSEYVTEQEMNEAIANVSILNQNGNTPLRIWAGTQQEYDELLTYDDSIVYLIEGRSSVIVTRYTITNNLTNVSTSNSANSIAEGSSYEAKLSVSTGYNIGNVSITMGGVNITSTCYNNKTINISSVTGNIVITAEAVESTGTTDMDSKYTLAYSLGEETVFDGSSNIETGVKLFDSDKDFTILADFTPSSQSVSASKQNVLFRIKQSQAPWIGIDISNWNGGTTTGNRGSMVNGATKKGYILGKICTGVPYDTTNRLKFVIKRVSADKKMYFYDSQGLIGSYSDAGDIASNPITNTIKLGGYSDATTNYMPCTVHTFKVYFDAVDDSDITTLLE